MEVCHVVLCIWELHSHVLTLTTHVDTCISVVPYSDIAFAGKGKTGNLEVVSYPYAAHITDFNTTITLAIITHSM